MLCDVLVDQPVGFDVDIAGAVRELRDEFCGDAGDLQGLVAVGAPVAAVPREVEA